jgi:hypothetical protein
MGRARHSVRALAGTRKAACRGLPALPGRDDLLSVDRGCPSERPVANFLTGSITFRGDNLVECDF